ncbi:MAG: hypothetical protein RLZZ136_1387 [Pseudomonadota bacterium]
MNGKLYEALTLIVPLVFAIVFHEVAHGLMARAMGDRTAAERRRLTLNPLRHVDPLGTIILPGMLALAHLPVFGWAKPVPVSAQRMRNPRLGMMLTAAAGPGINLLMGLAAAVALGLMARWHGAQQGLDAAFLFLIKNLINFIQINVFLALFNLIPIPPFDGSHILEGLLPRSLAVQFAKVRRLGFALVLIVLVVLPSVIPGFDLITPLVGPPVEWVLNAYGAIVDRLAGQIA